MLLGIRAVAKLSHAIVLSQCVAHSGVEPAVTRCTVLLLFSCCLTVEVLLNWTGIQSVVATLGFRPASPARCSLFTVVGGLSSSLVAHSGFEPCWTSVTVSGLAVLKSATTVVIARCSLGWDSGSAVLSLSLSCYRCAVLPLWLTPGLCWKQAGPPELLLLLPD
jgi:hypothetical protein